MHVSRFFVAWAWAILIPHSVSEHRSKDSISCEGCALCRIVRATMLLVVLCLVPVALPAQETQVCGNSVVVGVVDAHNLLVSGLKASDFKVSSRGAAPRVTSSEYRQNAGGRVVVLLDTSKRMGASAKNAKWRIANVMAKAFVTWMPPNEQITLIAFSEGEQRRFAAADGRKPIEEWLSSEPVSNGQILKGRSAWLDAVLAGIKELSPPQTGDALYIITDGGDNSSEASLERVERELLNSGIRPFLFLIFDKYASSADRAAGFPRLQQLVERSGGALVSLDRNSRLPPTGAGEPQLDSKTMAAMQETTLALEAQISNFYLLQIEGVDSADKPRGWTIEVADAEGHRRKDVFVTYPHRRVACRPQSSPAQ